MAYNSALPLSTLVGCVVLTFGACCSDEPSQAPAAPQAQVPASPRDVMKNVPLAWDGVSERRSESRDSTVAPNGSKLSEVRQGGVLRPSALRTYVRMDTGVSNAVMGELLVSSGAKLVLVWGIWMDGTVVKYDFDRQVYMCGQVGVRAANEIYEETIAAINVNAMRWRFGPHEPLREMFLQRNGEWFFGVHSIAGIPRGSDAERAYSSAWLAIENSVSRALENAVWTEGCEIHIKRQN